MKNSAEDGRSIHSGRNLYNNRDDVSVWMGNKSVVVTTKQ